MSSSNTNGALWWGLAGVGALLATRRFIQERRKIDYRNKNVVITGGSRGLGLVMARQLAQQGANLALCARDEAELQRAKAYLQQYDSIVFTYPCDVTDKAQIHEFIRAVRQELGTIDVLINNAGTIFVTPLEHATEEDFREAMDTNFWAAYHTVQEVLPQMRERRSGRIVNIASLGGKIAAPHLLPYVTSKFALVGYSEGLRTELLKDGIYVTTVCPGLMRTGSPRHVYVKGQHEKEYAWFKIGDSLPLLTISAEDSARQIIEACRFGKSELIISLPAKLSAAFHGVFPDLTADVLYLINQLLPDPGLDDQRRKGKDSESGLSHSILAAPTDRAAETYNQLGS